MATTITTQALSTTAAAITSATTGGGRRDIYIKNMDASIVVYIGDEDDVSATNGWPLAAGAEIKLEIDDYRDPTLYAVAASGTPRIAVIEQTRVSR